MLRMKLVAALMFLGGLCEGATYGSEPFDFCRANPETCIGLKPIVSRINNPLLSQNDVCRFRVPLKPQAHQVVCLLEKEGTCQDLMECEKSAIAGEIDAVPWEGLWRNQNLKSDTSTSGEKCTYSPATPALIYRYDSKDVGYGTCVNEAICEKFDPATRALKKETRVFSCPPDKTKVASGVAPNIEMIDVCPPPHECENRRLQAKNIEAYYGETKSQKVAREAKLKAQQAKAPVANPPLVNQPGQGRALVPHSQLKAESGTNHFPTTNKHPVAN